VRRADVFFGSFALVCAAAVTWPGHALFGSRVEPFVLGLPFSLAWNVGWVVLSFAAIATYHYARGRR
jgi:hypothetical protein